MTQLTEKQGYILSEIWKIEDEILDNEDIFGEPSTEDIAERIDYKEDEIREALKQGSKEGVAIIFEAGANDNAVTTFRGIRMENMPSPEETKKNGEEEN